MTESAPKVSVIIPLYNAEATIKATIQSVLETTWENLQIVVVDDASIDRGPEIVREMFTSLALAGCDCVFHSSNRGSNRGAAASRNLGARIAGGKYLAFLDSDDLYLSNRFEGAIELLEADPLLGAVFGIFRYELVSSDGLDQIRDISAKHVKDQGRQKKAKEQTDFLGQLLGGTIGLHTSTVTLRASVFKDLGMFPNIIFGEDQALWLRLLATWPVCRVSNEPVSVYRISEHSLCSRGQNQPEFIFSPVLSRIDAITWLRRNGGPDAPIERIASTIPGRLFTKYGLAREGSKELQRFMLRLLFKCPGVCPQIILNRNYWSILLRLMSMQLKRVPSSESV